ncbi:hypothetical protein [Clostridioides sp. ZZV15-6598]|nr:hypothetical protein [Clostridioides sp. ZZV15-6598]
MKIHILISVIGDLLVVLSMIANPIAIWLVGMRQAIEATNYNIENG